MSFCTTTISHISCRPMPLKILKNHDAGPTSAGHGACTQAKGTSVIDRRSFSPFCRLLGDQTQTGPCPRHYPRLLLRLSNSNINARTVSGKTLFACHEPNMIGVGLECSSVVMNDGTAFQKVGRSKAIGKSRRTAGGQHVRRASDIVAQSDWRKVAQKNGTRILNLRQHSLGHVH